MKIKLNVECLGLITGDEKRVLECYIDARLFDQRKCYDEYYVQQLVHLVDLYINDLMRLAEQFTVTVGSDCVYLKGI